MNRPSLGTTGKVASRKIADLVASRLRRMIARGELREGDWLPTEAELTEQFGVSRPTLREAFRLLEGDGLVSIRRGPPGGARVQTPGPEQAARLFGLILTLSGTTFADLYEARMVLEPPAVARLASTADARVVAELQTLVDDARSVVHDSEAFSLASTAFHSRLVELAGNHTLAAVMGMLSEITTRHVALGFRDPRRHDDGETAALQQAAVTRNERAVRSYAELVRLVEDRRPDDAEAYWRRHMRAVLAVLQDQDPAAASTVIDVLE